MEDRREGPFSILCLNNNVQHTMKKEDVNASLPLMNVLSFLLHFLYQSVSIPSISNQLKRDQGAATTAQHEAVRQQREQREQREQSLPPAISLFAGQSSRSSTAQTAERIFVLDTCGYLSNALRIT